MNKRERISQWLAEATGEDVQLDQTDVETNPYYRRVFSLLERTAVLRGARCPGTALAQHQIARRQLLQGIDSGGRRVRSSAKALRTSDACQAQQALASRGASVSVGAEESGELRAVALRAGCCSALRTFEPICR